MGERLPVVVCAGLSCLDLSLHGTTLPGTVEQITAFSHTSESAGGSAPQTAISLSCLGVSTAVVTLLGDDSYGTTLIALLKRSAVDTSAMLREPSTTTSLSVLPIFTDGRRGCFVTLGANLVATPEQLLSAFQLVDTSSLRVFHFGYPHLMPLLQGDALANFLAEVKARVPGVRLSLDLNGVNIAESTGNIVTPALPMVDFLHANLEEACMLTGLYFPTDAGNLSVGDIENITDWFTQRCPGVVAITAGKDGVFIACREQGFLYRSAYEISKGVIVNASGAGDAFVAGVLAMMAKDGMCDIARLADAGLVSALRRIDPTFGGSQDIDELLKLAQRRPRITPSAAVQMIAKGD